MATILKFNGPATSAPAAKKSGRRRRSAEIVIFPGVRIERWHDDHGAAAVANPCVARDILELVD
ncbi:MAG: hypothetical protein KDJ41_07725 [Hyphomicrobiaceae bacterium]|nr:hypothetical protein [Hyphomicrobiaceae bacterium]